MSFTTVDAGYLTSIHGIGREEALEFSLVLNQVLAAQAATPTQLFTRAMQQFVAHDRMGSAEAQRVMTALQNYIDATPNAADEVPLRLIFERVFSTELPPTEAAALAAAFVA